MGLKARIWGSRLEFRSLEWNMGLTARIWAAKLGGGVQMEEEEKEKEKKKKEKFLHM